MALPACTSLAVHRASLNCAGCLLCRGVLAPTALHRSREHAAITLLRSRTSPGYDRELPSYSDSLPYLGVLAPTALLGSHAHAYRTYGRRGDHSPPPPIQNCT